MGKEAYEIYKTKKKADNTDTLAEIKVFMSAQFVAKKSEYTEIMTFRRAFKNVDETVSDYAMRLRRLATDCNYGSTVEKEIERQFVVGCNMEEVQRKCCRTDDLDLKQVLEIATGFERINANVRNLRSPLDNPRHYSLHHIEQNRKHPDDRRSNQNKEEQCSNYKCGYCGKETHEKRSMCPARGSTCHKCGKLNHFQSVCRADAHTAALYKQNNSNSEQRSSYKRAPSPNKNSNQAKQASNSEKSENRVSQVSVGGSPQINDSNLQPLSQADLDDYWRYKKLLDYGLINFAIAQDHVVTGPRANVSIFDLNSSFLVDSGAPVNVIDEVTYPKIADKVPLEMCNINFYSYSAKTPLPILGQFVKRIQYKDRTATAWFIVIKGIAQNLLSFKSSVDLGIIRFDNPENPILDPDPDQNRMTKIVRKQSTTNIFDRSAGHSSSFFKLKEDSVQNDTICSKHPTSSLTNSSSSFHARSFVESNNSRPREETGRQVKLHEEIVTINEIANNDPESSATAHSLQPNQKRVDEVQSGQCSTLRKDN